MPWVTVVSTIPIQLFMTVWAGGFFGGFGMLGVELLGLDLPTGSTFIFFGVLAFFGIPVLTFVAKKRSYAATEYTFYPDRLEYGEGFWTAESKTIKYKNVTEVNLRRGVVQKKYGLGSLVLSTPATGGERGRSRSGIQIRDIENSEEVYDQVRKLFG
jgi:membrane protein YdbS with pleckstrin-like domain